MMSVPTFKLPFLNEAFACIASNIFNKYSQMEILYNFVIKLFKLEFERNTSPRIQIENRRSSDLKEVIF